MGATAGDPAAGRRGLIWTWSLSSHSEPTALTVGPTVSIHLDLPQVCLLQSRAKRMSHTVPLHRDPAFLGSEPSGPRACCLCGQPILESKGGPATRQGLGWLCALKGVGPPVLPVYSDTFW